MPPETWFDDPNAVLQWTGVDEDLHSQIAIWLTARVVNISSDTSGVFQESEFHALRAAMVNWEAMGGPATQPVAFRDRDAEADFPFPRILFSTHSCSECLARFLCVGRGLIVAVAIGHSMWNSAMVLLLEYEAVHFPHDSSRLREQAYKHALRAAGIIETNNHT